MTVETGGERLHRFADLARAVSGAPTLEDALHAIATEVASLRPDVASVIRVVDRGAGGYRLAATGGVGAEGLRPLLRFGEGLAHAIAEGGQSVLLADVRDDPRAVDLDWYAAHGLAMSYGVPIASGDWLLGVLSTYFPAGAGPTPEERVVIELLAAQAAVALENARLHEKVTRSQERYRAIVEDQTELIARFRTDGTLSFANGAYRRFFGEAPGEPRRGRLEPDASAVAEDDPARAFAALTPEQPTATVEQRVVRPDGEVRWLQWTDRAIFDEAGRLLEFQSVGRDVTERRAYQDQILESRKMEAVGELAGGLAHDFNNLLAVVMGHSHLLLGGMTKGEPLRRHAEEIASAAQQFASLTRQLLAFGRKQRLQPTQLALDAVLDAMEPMLRRVIPEDVELTVTRGVPAGRVKVDPNQLEQVVLSLALNARDAMPRGGRLGIATSVRDLDAAAGPRLGVPAGRYAVLSVQDTGVGMDAETRTRLFEPFFTTKARGAEKGVGLGLAVVHGIVKQSGGHIGVDSAPGRGTVLTVYLPLVGQEASP